MRKEEKKHKENIASLRLKFPNPTTTTPRNKRGEDVTQQKTEIAILRETRREQVKTEGQESNRDPSHGAPRGGILSDIHTSFHGSCID